MMDGSILKALLKAFKERPLFALFNEVIGYNIDRVRYQRALLNQDLRRVQTEEKPKTLGGKPEYVA